MGTAATLAQSGSVQPDRDEIRVRWDALEDLEALLGHRFRDRALLDLALTHPSVTHDLGPGTPHNQRLEFLGDAVLQLVLTLELYEKFPDLGEGPLTQARAEMVNRRTLAAQSAAMGVGRFLRLSRSEETTGGRDRASTLADAFEAVVGSIFLDGGLDSARQFVLPRFREAFGQLEALPSLHNPKGELQELLQAESAEAPSYQLISMTGPDHDRVFECAVSYRGETLGQGLGKTKKAAESEAALQALLRLRTGGQSGHDPTPNPDPVPPPAA
ncbi:MAG: ribonuclease III [Verrucomicrobiae bacterium]|nr:ribonuclease III [Verrucomicrobiae bacterium]